MYLTKWDKYLYRNYPYIKGGIILEIILVTIFCVAFPMNRLFHTIGAILVLISALVYYCLKKRYKYLVRSIVRRRKRKLYRLCTEKLNMLEAFLNRLDYLTRMDRLMILNSLWEELTCCATIRDYELLLKRINNNIYYFEEKVHEFERRKSNFKSQYQSDYQPRSYDNSVLESFQILGLSPDTDDFQLIKTRYRQLIKKYHPDINKSSNAVEKAQQINQAYEQLKTVFTH